MPDYAALERVKAALNNPRIGGEPATIWSDHGLRVDDVRALLSLAEKAERMGAALDQARMKFGEYAALHAAKGTPDGDKKALANIGMVNMITDALDGPRAALAPASPEGGG